MKIAIIGASGHGKVVAELAEFCGFEVIFFDDTLYSKKKVEDWPVKGSLNDLLEKRQEISFATVAIGDSIIRNKYTEILLNAGLELPILVHPNATVSKHSQLSQGTQVLAGAVINPFSIVGISCIINTNAVVEHDCVIGNYSHICPNATLAGGVNIGQHVWFGMNSCARQLIKIGEYTTIGMGSVVVEDIPSRVLAFGVPAKVKKYK